MLGSVASMITAVHALIYSDDPAATRAWLRDVLQWPFVADDGGQSPTADNWLIFASGPSEVGVHPTSGEHDGQAYSTPRRQEISLVCDDLDQTVADLTSRGATFSGEPMEMGFGRGVTVQVPGADDILIYQPHHTTAFDRA